MVHTWRLKGENIFFSTFRMRLRSQWYLHTVVQSKTELQPLCLKVCFQSRVQVQTTTRIFFFLKVQCNVVHYEWWIVNKAILHFQSKSYFFLYINSSFKKCKSKSMSTVADKQTMSNITMCCGSNKNRSNNTEGIFFTTTVDITLKRLILQ